MRNYNNYVILSIDCDNSSAMKLLIRYFIYVPLINRFVFAPNSFNIRESFYMQFVFFYFLYSYLYSYLYFYTLYLYLLVDFYLHFHIVRTKRLSKSIKTK